MEISQTGINLIKQYEGCRLTDYVCAGGVRTIGYGSTVNVTKGMTITQTEAESRLKRDLKRFVDGINQSVKVPLTQNQFDALVSFTFNIGVGAFTRSTMLKKLNVKDYIGAAEEFQRWNKAKGKVLRGLIQRRESERDLFLLS